MIEGYDYRITWTAPEYEHTEHTADWFWALGIISVSLAIAFVLLGNALLSIVILLGIGSLLFYAKHPPKIIECELSKRGVRNNKTIYPWDSLDSFCILDGSENHEETRAPKIILISKKPFMPHILVPLSEEALEEVHQALGHMLPEEPQLEPFANRIMHKIGF